MLYAKIFKQGCQHTENQSRKSEMGLLSIETECRLADIFSYH